MNRTYKIIRILTGFLLIIIFGAKTGILPNAVNMPEMFSPEGWMLIKAIQSNGYIFPTIGIVSLVSGLALLANRYVGIAALLMMPIVVNFALFHVFVGLPLDSVFSVAREAVGFIPLILISYVLYSQRSRFSALLRG